ncbi:MAG: ASKHA domain-containing protein [Firmicutes bacterium]|nr:ASKHA domain-containing protein [Bacillota bacterium]
MIKCTGNCRICGRCRGFGIGEEQVKRKAAIADTGKKFETDGRKGLGVAFDIGTTTVAGMLWDMEKAELLGTDTEANPQSFAGGDVISRISFCIKSEENQQKLREALAECLNLIIRRLCAGADADPDEIVRCVLCGNTTMSHIFAGFPVKSLSCAPFNSAYEGTLKMTGEEAMLEISRYGEVILMPGIGGHVGGDITAGVLACRMEEMQGLNLMIDIGTNGELVLSHDGRLCACSSAAGPAFEGASISCGMRAEKGAVETVGIKDGELFFRTVGGSPARGICGSGLIDAAASMVEAGILEESGRMNASSEDGEREFVILIRETGEKISLTQKDIRELQYAKGAIESSVKILLKEAGKTVEDLDNVFVAGAFGNYIDIGNSVKIGLLPAVDMDKIKPVGNTASEGAAMALLSDKELARAESIAKATEHIELADNPEFQNTYIQSLALKEYS